MIKHVDDMIHADIRVILRSFERCVEHGNCLESHSASNQGRSRETNPVMHTAIRYTKSGSISIAVENVFIVL